MENPANKRFRFSLRWLLVAVLIIGLIPYLFFVMTGWRWDEIGREVHVAELVHSDTQQTFVFSQLCGNDIGYEWKILYRNSPQQPLRVLTVLAADNSRLKKEWVTLSYDGTKDLLRVKIKRDDKHNLHTAVIQLDGTMRGTVKDITYER